MAASCACTTCGCAPWAACFSCSSFLFLRLILNRQMTSTPIRMAATPAPVAMPAMAAVDRPLLGELTGYCMAQMTFTTADVGLEVSVGTPRAPSVILGTVMTELAYDQQG